MSCVARLCIEYHFLFGHCFENFSKDLYDFGNYQVELSNSQVAYNKFCFAQMI